MALLDYKSLVRNLLIPYLATMIFELHEYTLELGVWLFYRLNLGCTDQGQLRT